MPVIFSSQDTSFLPAHQSNIRLWLTHVVQSQGFKVGDIHFIFCSDDYILKVNAQYLDHHYFTDVITFNYCTSRLIAGDILISIDTVRSNAEDYGVSFENELLRVLVHGVLHLLKYDDTNEKEQELMTKAENSMLAIYETKFR